MIQPRRRRGAALATYAALMLLAWIGMVFVAKGLAEDEKTAGFGAFLGFMVIAMSVVTYVLFMMAVDSDKA
ncbi:MAG TPA: hypothetical protein VK009_01520 [Chloroflexota bacterium]|nr:hypothetical protein [Chloroflexota bacterium]